MSLCTFTTILRPFLQKIYTQFPKINSRDEKSLKDTSKTLQIAEKPVKTYPNVN